jgi:hypothetical protein
MLLDRHIAYAANTITATGGGVVEQTKDIILTYNIEDANQQWSMCKWGRYEPTSSENPDFQFCLFTDFSQNGNVTKQTCTPSDFMESNQIEYIGTTKTECTIKIRNVSMDDAVTWAVNIESDVESKKINVTVATPLDNISQIIDPESVDAVSENVISCSVTGGEPIPEITFIYGTDGNPLYNGGNTTITVKNGSRVQQTETLENGKFKTTYNATIIPNMQDYGRKVDCVAVQYDKSDPKQILFKDSQGTNGSFNANTLTLNVQFPPQSIINQTTFSYVKGSDAQINIPFTANPKPTSIKWVVKGPNDTATNQTNENNETNTNDNVKEVDIDLPSTEDMNRYTVYNITLAETLPNYQYQARLDIANTTNADHLNVYYLLVTNLKGSQKFDFNINITDYVPSTTTPPTTTTVVANTTQTTPEGKSSSGAVTAVVVIVVIAILLVAGVIFYKKYYLHRETVPHYNLR